MHNREFEKYINLYRDNLLEDVVPFWMKNSLDKDYGGYFACLERDGSVFDTDKFIWLQCRQVWCFSMLYNTVEKKQEWLDVALHGADFLIKNGRDSEGNWFFSLNREGKALTQPHNIFSDCFATMAFGQLYKATGEKRFADIAVDTFNSILSRKDNPKGKYNKAVDGTRPIEGFSLPMILSNLVMEVEHLLEPALVEKTIQEAIHSVMNVFYQPDLGLILENVDPDGKQVDAFEGRLVNPGHGLEAMWLIMERGVGNADKAWSGKAVAISLSSLEDGWDNEPGGIFYCRDIKHRRPRQPEWDQILWWEHMATMIPLWKGYLYTDDGRRREWFLG